MRLITDLFREKFNGEFFVIAQSETMRSGGIFSSKKGWLSFSMLKFAADSEKFVSKKCYSEIKNGRPIGEVLRKYKSDLERIETDLRITDIGNGLRLFFNTEKTECLTQEISYNKGDIVYAKIIELYNPEFVDKTIFL